MGEWRSKPDHDLEFWKGQWFETHMDKTKMAVDLKMALGYLRIVTGNGEHLDPQIPKEFVVRIKEFIKEKS